MPGGVIVRALTADRVAEWDAFVAQCNTATFFHRTGWQRVIAESFGHRGKTRLLRTRASLSVS